MNSSTLIRLPLATTLVVLSLSLFAARLGGSDQATETSNDRQASSTTDDKDRQRWRKFRANSVVGDPSGGKLTDEQLEKMRQLEALGYLAGVSEAPTLSGVTIHDDERAFPGFNLWLSGHQPEAVLTDMDGNEIHSWRYDYRDAPGIKRKEDFVGSWRRTHLYENGDLLAIVSLRGLLRVDKDSNLKWVYPEKTHHDLFVTTDGTIYVLTRKAMLEPSIHPTEPIQDDFIDILDEHGRLLDRISVLQSFENSPYFDDLLKDVRQRMARRLESGHQNPGDIFHTNTVQVLDEPRTEVSPLFKKGNILVSLREPGMVAVIDPEKESVVWATTGPWFRQHDPVLLGNGRMLIFDNRGHDGFSKVLEFDPITLEVHWSYHGEPAENFFSKEVGTNQRLPNGNTLIVESDNGRAFEVVPDGTVVWEFVNPNRAGEANELIACLWELVRIPKENTHGWLTPGND